jgi:hypothetical protein
MIKIGDIVEYQYRGTGDKLLGDKLFYGIIIAVDDYDPFYCWIDWFHLDLGVEKVRTTYLKVLTQ